MRPASVVSLVSLVSALACQSVAFAQEAPSAPAPAPSASSPWVMPGNAPGIAVTRSDNGGFTFAPESPAPAKAEKPAEAPAPAKPRDYHFDLGVGTEFPISVGGVVTAELPHRFLLQLGLGVMPRAYSDAIDGALVKAGAYDAAVSGMIRNSIGNSMVLRASAGLRPFEDHGLELLGGYTVVTGGGSIATSDVISAILAESGVSVAVPAGVGAEIPVTATLHNVHASLGWRWLLADDHLVIRASISYIQTLGSRFSVKVPETATAILPYQGVINDTLNNYLNPYLAKYGKAPTLGLSMAYRF